MKRVINVFIPAAGLGERLRPITTHIPKPLLPVLGKPVIQHVLDNVVKLPFNRIGINLHYRKEAVEEWARSCSLKEKIVLFPEEKILGTGGALKNAGEFLKAGTFLVHNSDILSDINLSSLLDYHMASNNLVTLAVHDYPRFNSVVVDGNGILEGIEIPPHPPLGKGGRRGRVAFTGIAVYEPEFLDYLPEGKSSVVDAWLDAVAAGKSIGTFDVNMVEFDPHPYWSDIGTPDAYAAAVFELMRREGETVFVHPSIDMCPDIDMQGHVVIEEGCNVRALHATPLLRNCIVLPEGIIPPHPPLSKGGPPRGEFNNCIIGPGFKVDLTCSEILSIDKDNRQLIGSGGSDRRYYRTSRENKSVVLMQCKADDPDYERQIEYTKYFLKHTLPVPGLIEMDRERKNALIEDAGDISLYSWLKCPRDRMAIENIYRKVIDIIVLLHTDVTEDVSACPLLAGRTFDYEHFRWETEYFIKRFVEGVRNISIKNHSALDEELHQLAVKADALPKTVVHRDFQSQNIMVIKGRELRLIDYQGARLGPPAYDVASMLWDPYYRIEDGIREQLLDYYIVNMNSRSSGKFDEVNFHSSLVICRLQRHMQALGAYGFLSLVKGKSYFQKYMPEGVRLLKEDVCNVKEEFPELYELIIGL
ncbi:MAG: hypothetical protein C4581_06075 [Nitrospiraceae bacterium]|nr:MAG: hypothetical protein C4581_06075 [Nitrospiraceae bacterium]